MAKTKKENLKVLKVEELKKNLADLEESVRVFRFKAEGARSKNVKEAATLRKKIARILTEMNSR